MSALLLTPGVPLTHPAPHWSVDLDPLGDVVRDARLRHIAPEDKRSRVMKIADFIVLRHRRR